MITGKNYIGNSLSNLGSKTFSTYNPILSIENEWTFFEASDSEVNTAIALAKEAYETYRNISRDKKADFLNQIANEIEALGDELIKVYCKETGLPEGRAKGERGRTMGQLRSFAMLVKEGSWVQAIIDTPLPNRIPIPKPDLRKMMSPLGPVAVFGASNFPLAYSTAGGDTASALASGCPVIVKSHPMHAGTGELVASAIINAAEKIGMPNGVFSNLNSSGIEVGEKLVQHPNIKAVGFTGSIKGGRALFNMAALREEPIPVFAEMGSVNPVIFLPKALELKTKEWAKMYAGSITLGAGQFCTNPGLLFGIKSKELTTFIEELAQEILKVESFCMLNPAIKNNYSANKSFIQEQNGVSIVAKEDERKDNFANQVVATVSGNEFITNKSLHREVFGPFSMVVQCENIAELEKAIASLEGQLTGTIISEENEIQNYSGAVDALQEKVGRLIFNSVPTGVEVCPAMQHGGPYPASTDSRFGAVGTNAINRWVRPISYQSWPNDLLPIELMDENPLQIHRIVNGISSKNNIER
ncbi:aldehyde dehydrogenase (NADP(+)) [uncultured Croceitalea sp.]|uniref:aldehyde dehydrogenase (NADP(+)) n=1 Tax=uncultured Croceitalea sp. TaxID=1798908 RepID=UPI0033056B0C